jgi:hypothetical protein
MRLDIYNQLGGRRINLYACIAKSEEDKLVVSEKAGDNPPKDFRAGKTDVSFLLTFTK